MPRTLTATFILSRLVLALGVALMALGLTTGIISDIICLYKEIYG
jgi:hypothetical protein